MKLFGTGLRGDCPFNRWEGKKEGGKNSPDMKGGKKKESEGGSLLHGREGKKKKRRQSAEQIIRSAGETYGFKEVIPRRDTGKPLEGKREGRWQIETGKGSFSQTKGREQCPYRFNGRASAISHQHVEQGKGKKKLP